MGPLGITIGHDSLNSWQVLTVEFMLTFVVIFTTFATYDSNRRSFGSDSLSIGAAYLVASLTGVSLYLYLYTFTTFILYYSKFRIRTESRSGLAVFPFVDISSLTGHNMNLKLNF